MKRHNIDRLHARKHQDFSDCEMPLKKEKERANHVGTMPTCFTSEHHPEEKKEEEEVGEEMEFWIQSFGSIDFLG